MTSPPVTPDMKPVARSEPLELTAEDLRGNVAALYGTSGGGAGGMKAKVKGSVEKEERPREEKDWQIDEEDIPDGLFD